jgi:hypothetical protein
MLSSLTPFPGSTANGVTVAAVDRDGDGLPDVIVGLGPNAPSTVRSFKGTNLVLLNEFAPFDPSFMGGIFVG